MFNRVKKAKREARYIRILRDNESEFLAATKSSLLIRLWYGFLLASAALIYSAMFMGVPNVALITFSPSWALVAMAFGVVLFPKKNAIGMKNGVLRANGKRFDLSEISNFTLTPHNMPVKTEGSIGFAYGRDLVQLKLPLKEKLLGLACFHEKLNERLTHFKALSEFETEAVITPAAEGLAEIRSASF